MRLQALLVLIVCIFSLEAFSQVVVVHRRGPVVRGPRYNPPVSRPYYPPVVVRPAPYPRPMPAPVPRPLPPQVRRLTCMGSDLLNQNVIIHRFMFNSECREALQDARLHQKFCDDGSLYAINGRLIARFTFQSECKNALFRMY